MRNFTTWSVCRMEGGWRGRFHYRDDATGKGGRVTRNYRGCTRSEAERRARDEFDTLVRAERARAGGVGDGLGDPMELGRFLDGYIGQLARGGGIERTTEANYRQVARQITRHAPAGARVDELTPGEVTAMQQALLDDGLAASTVARCHRFLKQAVEWGLDMGALDRTPFNRSVRPPRRTPGEPNFLDDGERARLLSFLDDMGDTPSALGVRLGLGCGLRREEACGLTWACVDLEGSEIVVRQAVAVAGTRVVVKCPKTPSSRRSVTLDPDLHERLLKRRKEVEEEVRGRPGADVGRLYVLGATDGSYMRPERLTRDFATIARLIDLRGSLGSRVTFRDLRHTYATMLVARGVDPRTVASLMGHRSPKMTLDVYSAADPAARGRAADVIARAMAERPGTGGECV